MNEQAPDSPTRHDLLVEIGCEELPAGSVNPLAQALAKGLSEALAGADIAFDADGVRWFATPRRVAVLVPRTASEQPSREVERQGPPAQAAFNPDGSPGKAALGFAGSLGVAVEALERRQTDRGEVLYWKGRQQGQALTALLPELLERCVKSLPTGRDMRWGTGSERFVRPVRWLVILHGEKVIKADILGQTSSRITQGHPFMAPETIKLMRAEDYETRLAEAFVVADPAKRRQRIVDSLDEIAQESGSEGTDAEIPADSRLLDEVTALTEWPVPIAGSFDENFLRLPDPVLVTSMAVHQRFFPVFDADGSLFARFIGVSNVESPSPEVIREGYERVIRPRLADAAFFFEEDRQQPLAHHAEGLADVVFQAQLGSVADRLGRMQALAQSVASAMDDLEPDDPRIEQVISLAKADLLTQMVGEFPELQGVIGRHYALAEGIDQTVADAIEDHYRPRFSGDELPRHSLGAAVALADRLDLLAGVFAIGKAPKGNKDPFALRRAALGLWRIAAESASSLSLRRALGEALNALPIDPAADELDRIWEFVLDRARAWYQGQGIDTDVCQAVFSSDLDQPADLQARVDAVNEFKQHPAAPALAAAHKRIDNILRQQAQDNGLGLDAGSDNTQSDDGRWSALVEPAEQQLAAALSSAQKEVGPLVARRDYGGALQRLALMREPIDHFFDQVMVMCEDRSLRQARLQLLAEIRRTFGHMADLSLLQIETE